MSNLEYKVVTSLNGWEFSFPPKFVEWEPPMDIITRMSTEGWELVTVVTYPVKGLGNWMKEYYFRRPKQ